MFRHILVPTDGSAHASRALAQAVKLAKAVGARVTILTVVEPFHAFTMDMRHVSRGRAEYEAYAKAQAVRILADADKVAQKHGVAYATLQRRHEQPHKAILEAAAKRSCDLVVMGSHGRHGIANLMLGSVANKVLAQSKVPVLIYR